MPLISEYWLCIQLFCQIHLLGQVVFWIVVYRIFHVHYHVICKQWQFHFLLSNLDAFFPFSSLIAGTRASSTMLNRSGERRHPCLVPDLSGKVLSFCPLSMMLAVIYMAFIMLRNAPSIPTLLSVFYQKWVLYLIKCFFLMYWYDHVIFFLYCCLCGVLCLLICAYCTILASLGWIPLGHGGWCF